MKLWLFPVPVRPEVDSPTGVHFRLLPTDYGCLLQRNYQTTGSRPARFLLPIALFPVPAWRQTRSFCMNFRPNYYLGTALPELRAEGHPGAFGTGDYFRSVDFHFRWDSPAVQECGLGQRQIRLASGATKPGFFM